MASSEGVEAYPLCWPKGRPRRAPGTRERSAFRVSFSVARDELMREISLLRGKLPVLSTNVALRRDGLPYSGMAQPDDVGVAVYFELRGKQFAFACDRWTKVEHNVQAIRHTINALRGIERWGTGDMVQAAFTGFAALPSPAAAGEPSWRTVLGCGGTGSLTYTLADVEALYRRRRSEAHPDKRGGDAREFDLVQRAWDQAQQELRK